MPVQEQEAAEAVVNNELQRLDIDEVLVDQMVYGRSLAEERDGVLTRIPIGDWNMLNAPAQNDPVEVVARFRDIPIRYLAASHDEYTMPYGEPVKVKEVKPQIVREEVLKYKDLYGRVLHTGSSVIVAVEDQPIHKPQDDDWVILVPEMQHDALVDRLVQDGYYVGGSFDPRHNKSEGFTSYKKDGVNLIVTSDPNFFEDFANATKLAKFLNLKEKPQRVALFKAIRDNIWPEVDL